MNSNKIIYSYIGSCIYIYKARKKNVLVLVIGRVDFDENKKKVRAAKYM